MSKDKIVEVLSVTRSDMAPGSEISPITGAFLTKVAVPPSFDVNDMMDNASLFITEIYRNDTPPDHLVIYNTGSGQALACILLAWQTWHETTFNVKSSVSIMHYYLRKRQYREQVWFGKPVL